MQIKQSMSHHKDDNVNIDNYKRSVMMKLFVSGLMTSTLRLFLVLTVLLSSATSFAAVSIFQPKSGQIFDDEFNIVAQRVGSSLAPGAVEVASDASFDNIKISSDSWVPVEDWWQLAIPKNSLENGTYWLRIEGDNTKVIEFEVNIPDQKEGIVRDPTHYGSSKHVSGQEYTLSNLWMRSEGTGNGLNEDHIEGAVNNYMIVHDGYLYKPVFRVNYTAKLSESPQQLRRIDLTDGRDNLIDFTTKISYYQNRRFEALGTDDTGTPWIASVFNTYGSEKLVQSEQTDYYTNVLISDKNTQDAIVIGKLDFNPEGNRISNIKVLKLTDLRKNLGANVDTWKYRLLTTDLKVRGDLNGDDYNVSTAISFRFYRNTSEYSIYSWNPSNVTNKTSSFVSYKNIQGNLAQTAPYNDKYAWVKGRDYLYNSKREYVPLQFCNLATGDTLFTVGLDKQTADLRKSCLDNEKKFDGGTSVYSFELEGHKFLIHSVVITPYVRFALRAVPDNVPKSASEVPPMFYFPATDLGAGAEYLNETLSGIYVDVHDNTASKSALNSEEAKAYESPYADIYVYAGYNMLGAYRLKSFIVTGVEDIVSAKPKIAFKVKYRTLTVLGVDEGKLVRIHNVLGENILTAYINKESYTIDLQSLPTGIYIASIAGEHPYKFIIR